MADITVSYKGTTIAEVSASGTTTLGTSGKYCEDDISIAYTKPSGSYIGGTVVWNQLQENGNFESTSNINAYNGTISASNGVLSYTVSSLGGSSNQIRMPSVSCVDGHKYLLVFAIKPAHSKTNQTVAFLLRTSGSGPNINFGRFNLVGGEWNRISYIADINASGTTYGTLQILFNATSDNGYSIDDVDQVKDVMCIDITRLFGSTIADYIYTLEQGTAGAGIAWLKANGFFSKPYYPYAAASLQSVELFVPPIKDSNGKIIGYFPQNFNFELRGILKLNSNNNLYYDGDEYDGNGTVTRKCGFRAYESGDETDGSTMITDGSNTVYLLSIPTTESV